MERYHAMVASPMAHGTRAGGPQRWRRDRVGVRPKASHFFDAGRPPRSPFCSWMRMDSSTVSLSPSAKSMFLRSGSGAFLRLAPPDITQKETWREAARWTRVPIHSSLGSGGNLIK